MESLNAPKINDIEKLSYSQLYDLCCKQSHALKESDKCINRYMKELAVIEDLVSDYESRLKLAMIDAKRYRHMRNLTVEQAGAPGQPSIALPSGFKHGYYLTEETADYAIDESIKEHMKAQDA